ncbi:MAG: dihydropteroate synthase, partial [Muribaculaceae bacterium]|nr:dihydropteroate synthase [Muribaculaceae bacterium]
VVSIDTFRADVAERCVREWGADIVNDISGGLLDPRMPSVCGELQVPVVVMHMRGTPATMQQLTDYNDPLADTLSELARRVQAFRECGVADVIIDPGFGFAKTTEQNYAIMRGLPEFEIFQAPLLVGISRKSMIYKPLGITPEQALNGTTALNMIALQGGADILRVHDVKEAVETVKIFKLLNP